MIPVAAWYRGEPEALEAGIAALKRRRAFRKDSTDIREAVARMQKRWGHTPSGTLSALEWRMLHDFNTKPEEES